MFEVMGGVRELNFGKLGWGDAEIKALAVVLPLCRQLTKLKVHVNSCGDAGMVAMAGAMGALDKLEVSWCPNALSPCPETLHVHSPDSEHLFDVPYAGA